MNQNKQTAAQKAFEKVMDEAELHLKDAHNCLRKAYMCLHGTIPVPYHIEKAKLETRHALNRFKVRRSRLND